MKKEDIKNIAGVIKTIYSNSKNKMVSVLDAPLTPIFKDFKIYAEDRARIMDYLKANLIFHEGERAGMKYMWKGDLADPEVIALRIVEYYEKLDNEPLTGTRTIRKEVIDTTVRNKEKIKSNHMVGDRGYLMFDDAIYEGYICEVQQFPGQQAKYKVLISYKGENCILFNITMYSHIDLLLKLLERNLKRFQPDLPLEKIKETTPPPVVVPPTPVLTSLEGTGQSSALPVDSPVLVQQH